MHPPHPDLPAIALGLARLAARASALTPAQSGIAAAALLTRLGIDNDEAAQALDKAVLLVAGALARGHGAPDLAGPVIEAICAQVQTGDVVPLIEAIPNLIPLELP